MEEKKVEKKSPDQAEMSSSEPEKKTVKRKKSIFKEKKFLLVLLAVFILLIAGSGILYWQKTNYDPARYQSEVDKAQEAYEQMKYGEALEAYIMASEIAPSQPDAYLGMVVLLVEKNRFDDVEKLLSEISGSVESSDVGSMYMSLGEGYVEYGMYEEGFNAYHKAYKANSSEEASEGALKSAMLAGDLNNAERYYDIRAESAKTDVDAMWEDYIEMSDDEAELHEVAIIAKDLLNDGYSSLAKEMLEPRKEEMNEYWEGRYFLGRAYFDLGDYEKAGEELNTAVSLGSDDYALYLYMARLNVINGDKNKAYKYYDRAVEFVSDDKAKDIVLEYAELLVDDQQYVRAQELLTQFQDQGWSQIAFMKLYSSQSEYEKMLEASEKYVVDDEVDQELVADYYVLLLEYHAITEDGEQMDPVLVELEALEGHESLYYYYRGIEAMVIGDPTSAEEFLKMSIDTDLKGEISEEAEKQLSNL